MRMPGFTAASSLRPLSTATLLMSDFLYLCTSMCVKWASDCSDRCVGDDFDCEDACFQWMLDCFAECYYYEPIVNSVWSNAG